MSYRLDNVDKVRLLLITTMHFASNNIMTEYEMNGTFFEAVIFVL